jgi:hypothetical protein
MKTKVSWTIFLGLTLAANIANANTAQTRYFVPPSASNPNGQMYSVPDAKIEANEELTITKISLTFPEDLFGPGFTLVLTRTSHAKESGPAVFQTIGVAAYCQIASAQLDCMMSYDTWSTSWISESDLNTFLGNKYPNSSDLVKKVDDGRQFRSDPEGNFFIPLPQND